MSWYKCVRGTDITKKLKSMDHTCQHINDKIPEKIGKGSGDR